MCHLFVFMMIGLMGISGKVAEKFPTKPINSLAGTTPGAIVDVTIRALAEPTSKILDKC